MKIKLSLSNNNLSLQCAESLTFFSYHSKYLWLDIRIIIATKGGCIYWKISSSRASSLLMGRGIPSSRLFWLNVMVSSSESSLVFPHAVWQRSGREDYRALPMALHSSMEVVHHLSGRGRKKKVYTARIDNIRNIDCDKLSLLLLLLQISPRLLYGEGSRRGL